MAGAREFVEKILQTEISHADAGLIGKTVSLAATDYGRDHIIGTLAGSSHYSLTVARNVPGLGRINVHVPRLGYSLTFA